LKRRAVQSLRQHGGNYDADHHRFIVQKTGSFNGALVFVGFTALMAIFSYVVIVGEIKRVKLPEPTGGAA